MHHTFGKPTPIGEVIHKEKRSKKESSVGQLPIVQLEGSTQGRKAQEENKKQLSPEVAASRRQAAHVDAYLYGLVMEGLIDPLWAAWHAGAIKELSLTRYNMLVIMTRNARKVKTTRARLLSSKVKTALDYERDIAKGKEY